MTNFNFSNSKTVQLNVRVEPEMFDAIEQIANENNVNRVEAIRALLDYAIKEYDEKSVKSTEKVGLTVYKPVTTDNVRINLPVVLPSDAGRFEHHMITKGKIIKINLPNVEILWDGFKRPETRHINSLYTFF